MYRKFTADHIFNGKEMLPQGAVLVTDADGHIMDIIDKKDACDDVEAYIGVLTPGLINCHCHLELSHMKGLIPKHTGLVDFVLRVVNERHFDEQEVIAGIEKGEFEMWENGIVAVGDICNNTLTIGQKAEGRLSYHNFIEASGFPPAVAASRFQRAVDIYNAYAAALPSNSIVAHAPYSVSPELFSMINAFPHNDLLTIHNQEIAAENEFFQKSTGDLLRIYEAMGIDISFFKPSGKTSPQTYLSLFTKAQSIILVHNLATSTQDIEFTKLPTANCQLLTFFCLCPNANLYISNMLPDVQMLINHQCDIVLGTDSLASNDQLSILAEMKTLQQHFPSLELTTLLQWATSNGARALQMDDMFGSFEKLMKPGIVLIAGMEEGRFREHSKVRRIL